MREIGASEMEIRGDWVMDSSGMVVRDDATKRIDHLVRDYLEKLGSADAGWSTLYRDPDDGRFWEHFYPCSQMHGGGPPSLRVLRPSEVSSKYGAEFLG